MIVLELADPAAGRPAKDAVREKRRARVKLEAGRRRALAHECDDMDLVTSLRKTAGDFFDVHRAPGAARDVLVGSDVENLQTASSSRKNGPVRTRPNSATSSFMT